MSSKENSEALLIEFIHQWYPDLHNQTHFYPPFYLNKVPFELVTLTKSRQQALVLKHVPQEQAHVTSSRQRRRKRRQEAQRKNKTHRPLSASEASRSWAKFDSRNSSRRASDEACAGNKKLSEANFDREANVKTSSEVTFGSANFDGNESPVAFCEKTNYGNVHEKGLSSSLPSSFSHFPHDSTALWHEQPVSLGPPPLKFVHNSDVRDNQSHQHVLFCLRALAARQREVMFVISNLRFENYLNSKTERPGTEPVELLETNGFPKPSHRGEFDVLIVHRVYGFIVLEIKSVGGCSGVNITAEDIRRRVELALRQLEDAQAALDQIVSDLPRPVCVTKVIALPNVTSDRLRSAVESDQQLQQKLIRCLHPKGLQEALDHFLCANDLSPRSKPWAVSDTLLADLQRWWTRCVVDNWSDWAQRRHCPRLREQEQRELYEKLVARFCGPATFVDLPTVTSERKDVRTVGEGVADTGLSMRRLCLYPAQVQLLEETGAETTFLAGPPGTGKSVLLALKGLQWLNEGEKVFVVSTWKFSRASSFLLECQLLKSSQAKQQMSNNAFSPTDLPLKVAPSRSSRVCHVSFDLEVDNVKDAVDVLIKAARDGDGGGGDVDEGGRRGGGDDSADGGDGERLHVLMDEAGPFTGTAFKEFCYQLMTRVPKVSLWAASIQSSHRPNCLREERLTAPLRCPPAVVREIAQAQDFQDELVYGYSLPTVPPPSDGPEVIWLRHTGQPHHLQDDPRDCDQCGLNIATLLNTLNVGLSDSNDLHYRDVLILFCDAYDDSDENDSKKTCIPNKSPQRTNGIIRGLRSQGVPVKVLSKSSTNEEICDFALARQDSVTVADLDIAMGLERSVVIGVGDVGVYNDRLYSMSRCTAQLVWIDKPFTCSSTPKENLAENGSRK